MSAASANAARDAYLDLIKRSISNYLYLGGDKSLDEFVASTHYDLAASRWTIEAASRPMTLLTKAQLDLIEDCVLRLEHESVPGDYIEAGVWRGGAIVMIRALVGAYGIENRQIIAADSFDGIPTNRHFSGDPVDAWRDRWAASFEEVSACIRRFGLLDDRIEFVRGLFSETLPTLSDRRFALVRLDSDSYESTACSLDYLYPLLSEGGIVIVDDWHLPGCRRAVIEFRARHEIPGSISLHAGNAVWTKS